jgi:L-threonylcarbamoyladenylate synthase
VTLGHAHRGPTERVGAWAILHRTLETTVVMLDQHDVDTLDATAAALRAGRVVVLPTDTVYGLAALPDHAEGVQAIYRAKGRPEGMHLPVLGASLDQVRRLGVDLTGEAESLAQRWWPGPLTMVFGFDPRSRRPGWLDGRDEVAVRIPQHAFLLALLETTGVLLVTSANPHGSPTPTSAQDVIDALGGPDGPDGLSGLVIDGGALEGEPSTLVNLRTGRATIEREGALSRQVIADTLGATGAAP